METNNKYIVVSYKLYVKDEDTDQEELQEQATAEQPFQFISDLGFALPSFENEVKGLAKGEEFDFTIQSKDAYGEYSDEMMFDVPKDVFMINGRFDKERIYEGNIIPLQGENGERFNGIVIEVKDEAVTIDLNHPLAGQDLHFHGYILENRDATEDEIKGMKNMLEGGCECGCGCHGDCDGDCDCDGDHHHHHHHHGEGCGCHHDDHNCGCGHH